MSNKMSEDCGDVYWPCESQGGCIDRSTCNGAYGCATRGGRVGERRKGEVMLIEVGDDGARYDKFPWPGNRLIDNRRAPGGSERRSDR